MSAAVASELTQIERRARVVDLAKTGRSYQKIADDLGIANKSTVARDIQAWAAETRPTSEATEELRKLQAEQIDALFEGLWDRRLEETVVDRLVKLMERKSRLFGLDLTQNVQVAIVTAEGMAEFLGWAGDAPVVDVVAEEITDGSTT